MHEISTHKALCNSAAASMAESVRRTYEQPSLYDQIGAFEHLNCADPRDKVYALLGVVDLEKEGIEPDYTVSIQQVLHQVLRNHHKRCPPKSLREVINQCAYLATSAGLHRKSMLDLSQKVNDHNPMGAEMLSQFPMHDGKPGSLENLDPILMLWWADAYDHPVVQTVWHDKYDQKELQQIFCDAVKRGQTALLDLMLRRQLVDHVQSPLTPPLFTAVNHSSVDSVKFLLARGEFGVDKHVLANGRTITPLTEAFQAGREDMLLLILRSGKPINWRMELRIGHPLKAVHPERYRMLWRYARAASISKSEYAMFVVEEVWRDLEWYRNHTAVWIVVLLAMMAFVIYY